MRWKKMPASIESMYDEFAQTPEGCTAYVGLKPSGYRWAIHASGNVPVSDGHAGTRRNARRTAMAAAGRHCRNR